MATNKRQLKKYIDRIGCDVAEIILPGAVYTNKITDEQAREILLGVSQLGTEAHARLAIAFDKSPEAFENMRKYHAARRSYFRQAYAKAIDDYEKGIEKLLQPINNKA